MSGNTYSYITPLNTWDNLIARLNNLVSELNNKVLKFDVSNSGKKVIISANVVANGAILTVRANTTFTGANTNLLGKTILIKANTNLNGANTSIRGGSLLVLSNTNFTSISGIRYKGIDIRATFAQNTAVVHTTGNETITGQKTFTGSNTSIKSKSFYVSSNTVITGNTVISNTFIATHGAPIKSIGYGSNSYTLVISDNGKYLRAVNTGGMTLTVPTNSTVPFPIGTEIVVIRAGANNALTFANTSTVVLNYAEGKKKLKYRYHAATLKKIDTNVWDLVGNLSS